MSHLHLSWGMCVVLGGSCGEGPAGELGWRFLAPTLHFSEPQFLRTFSDR